MVRMLELRPCAKATDLERMSVQSWPSSRHAIAKSMEFFVVKKSAIDAYYRLVRTAPARHLHNRLRRWLHHWRYGVNSVSMFRNVEMEINSTCNRSCWYCPDSFARRPVGYMSDGLFRKIIAELAEMDFDGNVSYHFYGEPLLDKRLLAFVEWTASCIPKCWPVIYSNGDFLTLDLFRQFIQRGRASFFITQHDDLMPPHLQQIFDQATEEEKTHIAVHFGKDICSTNRSGLIAARKLLRGPLPMPCDWPLATMVITMNGNVVPCCNDYFETEVVGNVATNSLREVWCSESFERFRRALSNADRTASQLCRGCDYVPSQSHLLRIVRQ
jgi:radical SAM protein with 4Fe4S-binding SPASM domain